jgi:hypothetical protein
MQLLLQFFSKLQISPNDYRGKNMWLVLFLILNSGFVILGFLGIWIISFAIRMEEWGLVILSSVMCVALVITGVKESIKCWEKLHNNDWRL